MSARAARVALVVVAAVALSGCAQIGYLWQSTGGHLKLLNAAKPVDEVLAEPGLAPARHRAAPARQRQLPPLRRSRPQRRGLERGGRARAEPAAQDLVFPGGGLRRLPRLLRPG